MRIQLVRHAHARPRAEWSGREVDRPLTARGHAEAEALAEHLVSELRHAPDRLLCSPALRCRETVAPLARMLGLEVTTDPRLGSGGDTADWIELLADTQDDTVLVCSHDGPITDLLAALELDHPARDGRIPCRKGSVWHIEGLGNGPMQAHYREPVRAERPGRTMESAIRYLAREVERPDPVRAAVLDLGSTSFHLLIADVTRCGEIRPVVREKVMLRLGAEIASRGHIPDSVARRAVDVARELAEHARREKVMRFWPVATAALREADNGREMAERISRALREPVRIMSGRQEARVVFRAFQRRTTSDEAVLGMDLGGGSLELAAGAGRHVASEVTLPLGAVRLQRELGRSDRLTRGDVQAIRARVRAAVEPQRDALLGPRPNRAVATGGTARALARLAAGEADEGDALTRLDRRTLRKLRRRLVRSSHDERLAMPGMRRNRADLLPVGAVVLETACDVLDMDGLSVCDWGMREGVLLTGIADLAR